MLIIAHRALLHGPDRELENRPETIRKAIAKGFHVEVDVWVLLKKKKESSNHGEQLEWWLGHDGPQYQVDFSFLESIAPKTYFHAKNGEALFQFLQIIAKSAHPGQSPFRCFFHDVDEYTITSNGKIWAYPGKTLFPSDSTICVMPERAKVQENLSKCLGICTDFAELYQVYDEMATRQHASVLSNKLFFDELITPARKVDSRLCLAAYTWYDHWTPSEHWAAFHAQLQSTFPDQNVYGIPRDSDNVLHFTLIQILGFAEFLEAFPAFASNQEQYLAILQQVLEPELPFDITFRGVIGMQSGLLLTGYPSIDINSKIRARLYEAFANAKLYAREYQNNIVHSTIVRLSTPGTNVSGKILEIVDKYRDTYFGTLKVTGFDVGKSSWRMQTGELTKLARIGM